MSSIIETNCITEFSTTQAPNCGNYAQEQQVHDLLQFIKLEHKKNVGYQLLLNILEEYSQDDNDNDKLLKEKIKNIILKHNTSQLLPLDYKTSLENGMSVLGINNVKTASVSYLEGTLLQKVIKLKLDERKDSHCKHWNNTNEHLYTDGYTAPLQLSKEEKYLLSTKRKLISEQEYYIKNLTELEKILVEISQLRLKTLPDGIELKIQHVQAQEKINNLKAHFTEGKIKYDILTETNCSLQAYKELIKDIKSKQLFYQKEIQTLEDLKEKYKQVSCKQFDDILHSYQQYKSSLEQKKKLLDYLTT